MYHENRFFRRLFHYMGGRCVSLLIFGAICMAVSLFSLIDSAEARLGRITVYIEPQGARAAGAEWRVIREYDGRVYGWKNSGQRQVLGNYYTDYTLQFKDVAGWIKPPDETGITIGRNDRITRTGWYTQILPLAASAVSIKENRETAIQMAPKIRRLTHLPPI